MQKTNRENIAKKLPELLANYNFFVTFASAIKPKSSIFNEDIRVDQETE